ncbi:probable G-protein coupled receptor 33 [Rhineura floridana]|uniref:probable G-protein coupled receptor 33 n=1 Tax=Rhineura floridana TaxID=261503 RepID=UPI002AC7F3E4|nr:probable G-protein coupled receptor 33 [Rhineura floridana]
MNASHSTVVITTTNLPIAILIMVSFLVGTAVNGVFLWVLGMKMKRTVNTTWFLHLILTYLLSCSLLPFFAVFVFFDFDWIFGPIMCKFLLSSFSLGMFTTVFLLTTVSLDRFLITCHSVWSRRNRTIPHAQRVIAGVWLASLVLSAPNFPFLEIREVEGKRKCGHEFRVHLAFFLVQFLLAFLFPFIIIMTCYCWIGCEMKKKRLLRTGKTFRVLVAVVASFFICWLPYHLYRASLLLMKESELIVQVLWDTAAAGVCFNICFTPILYLFVGEKFQEVFKRSIFAFLQGFADDPVSPGDQ